MINFIYYYNFECKTLEKFEIFYIKSMLKRHFRYGTVVFFEVKDVKTMDSDPTIIYDLEIINRYDLSVEKDLLKLILKLLNVENENERCNITESVLMISEIYKYKSIINLLFSKIYFYYGDISLFLYLSYIIICNIYGYKKIIKKLCNYMIKKYSKEKNVESTYEEYIFEIIYLLINYDDNTFKKFARCLFVHPETIMKRCVELKIDELMNKYVTVLDNKSVYKLLILSFKYNYIYSELCYNEIEKRNIIGDELKKLLTIFKYENRFSTIYFYIKQQYCYNYTDEQINECIYNIFTKGLKLNRGIHENQYIHK